MAANETHQYTVASGTPYTITQSVSGPGGVSQATGNVTASGSTAVTPAFIGESQIANATLGATSITIPHPAGISAGDLLIAIVFQRTGLPTITTPANWTLRGSSNTDAAENSSQFVYTRVYAAGQSTPTFTSSSNNALGGVMIAIDAGTYSTQYPLNVNPDGWYEPASQATTNSPSIDLLDPETLQVVLGTFLTGADPTLSITPSGWNVRGTLLATGDSGVVANADTFRIRNGNFQKNGINFVPTGFVMMALGLPDGAPTTNSGPSVEAWDNWTNNKVAFMAAMKDEWHVDTMRLQLGQNGVDPQGDYYSQAYVDRIVSVVGELRDNGFITILCMNDWETSAGKSHKLPTAHTNRAWQKLIPYINAWPTAKRTGVALEIFNEPWIADARFLTVTPTANDWSQWRNGGHPTETITQADNQGHTAVGHQDVLATIRAASWTGVVIASGQDKGHTLNGMTVLTDTLATPNVGYAIHTQHYHVGGNTALQDQNQIWEPKWSNPRDSLGIAVTATEWGPRIIIDEPGLRGVTPDYLDWHKNKGIGMQPWAIDTGTTGINSYVISKTGPQAWDPTDWETWDPANPVANAGVGELLFDRYPTWAGPTGTEKNIKAIVATNRRTSAGTTAVATLSSTGTNKWSGVTFAINPPGGSAPVDDPVVPTSTYPGQPPTGKVYISWLLDGGNYSEYNAEVARMKTIPPANSIREPGVSKRYLYMDTMWGPFCTFDSSDNPTDDAARTIRDGRIVAKTWNWGIVQYNEFLQSPQLQKVTDWLDMLGTNFNKARDKYNGAFWINVIHEPEGEGQSKADRAQGRLAHRKLYNELKARGVTNVAMWGPTYMQHTFSSVAYDYNGGTTRGDPWWEYYPDWKGTITGWKSAWEPNPADFYMDYTTNPSTTRTVDVFSIDIYCYHSKGGSSGSREPQNGIWSWSSNMTKTNFSTAADENIYERHTTFGGDVGYGLPGNTSGGWYARHCYLPRLVVNNLYGVGKMGIIINEWGFPIYERGPDGTLPDMTITNNFWDRCHQEFIDNNIHAVFYWKAPGSAFVSASTTETFSLGGLFSNQSVTGVPMQVDNPGNHRRKALARIMDRPGTYHNLRR